MSRQRSWLFLCKKGGATNLTAEERKMVDRVKRLWLNKNKKR